jgi:hypothetical protein
MVKVLRLLHSGASAIQLSAEVVPFLPQVEHHEPTLETQQHHFQGTQSTVQNFHLPPIRLVK